MPRLTIEISDEALGLLRTAMGIRIIADAAHGVPDEVVRKILAALDRGDSECMISTRAERERAVAKSNPVADCREPSPNPLSAEESS